MFCRPALTWGAYQIGDVQARSWITFWDFGIVAIRRAVVAHQCQALPSAVATLNENLFSAMLPNYLFLLVSHGRLLRGVKR